MNSRSVRPTKAEESAPLPGDEIVPEANVVMDRAFTLDVPSEVVWPWFAQLGKRRAGWYLPAVIERIIPPKRRGLRHIDAELQQLAVGDIIPDWGGKDATFEVAVAYAPYAFVYTSTRGRVTLSWAVTLTARTDRATRVHLRLRLGNVKRERLARIGGGFVDWLTIYGLAAGLRERVIEAN